jgi:phosphatidylinositol alpha-mannosyltransferase
VRVALVCPYDLGVPGGVQDQVVRLREWVGAMGHEAWIVAPGTEDSAQAIPDGTVLVGSSTVVRANRSAAPIALDPRVAGRVRSAVADADVVHIHEPFMPVVSLTATRIADLPTVGTFHADASPLVRRALRVGGGFARAVAGRLDVVTAVSEVARSSVPSIARVRIIPNGIDIAAYAPSEKDPTSVVFVGRDDPRKGLDVLLGAWEAVAAAAPGAHLTVVGAWRDAGPERVEFMGRVDEATKRAVLGRAGIAVAPNLGGESFGIVVAEGMASGCAVVASAIPAFTTVLGDAGEFVRPGDPQGLAQRLIALLARPDRQATLGAEAMVEVSRFGADTVTVAYLDAYRDAIVAHA